MVVVVVVVVFIVVLVVAGCCPSYCLLFVVAGCCLLLFVFVFVVVVVVGHTYNTSIQYIYRCKCMIACRRQDSPIAAFVHFDPQNPVSCFVGPSLS